MKTTERNLLKVTFENAKLKGICHFSLPSGWTCPGAESCKTFADKTTGKITDAQKAVAEMTAVLYDESLDQYKPHQWQTAMNVFRQDYARLYQRFSNQKSPFIRFNEIN